MHNPDSLNSMPNSVVFCNAYESTSALLSKWNDKSVNELELLTPCLNSLLPRFCNDDISYSSKAHPDNYKPAALAYSVQRLGAENIFYQTTMSNGRRVCAVAGPHQHVVA